MSRVSGFSGCDFGGGQHSCCPYGISRVGTQFIASVFIRSFLIILTLTLLWRPAPPRAEAQDEVTWLHNQINGLRASLGIHGYSLNPSLMAAAQAHSEWMASTGIISHEESDGSTPGDRAAAHGYTGSWVSENIYGGMMGTAEIAWNWWMNSSIHYAGITDARKNELGIGVSGGYYTLVFGIGSNVQAPAPPEPENVPPQPEVQPEPVQPAAQQPAPPQPPPPLTWTPSPTIPTATPTITWTPTFTWTPSPTPTLPPPTSTPIILPTADLGVVAVLPSPSPTPLEIADSEPQTAIELPPAENQPTLVATAGEENAEIPWKMILPLLIIGQALLMGGLAYRWFLRSPRA